MRHDPKLYFASGSTFDSPKRPTFGMIFMRTATHFVK